MATRLFDEWEMEAGLTEDGEGYLYDDRDNPIQLESGDILHLNISQQRGGNPAITLKSSDPVINDSRIVVTALGDANATPPTAAHFTFRLAGAATTSFDGVYFVALDLEDVSETHPANARKPIARGTFRFQPNVPQV